MPDSRISTLMNLTSRKSEDEIRESMRRCPETAIAAAIEFNETRDPECLSEIVFGIIERYIEPSLRELIRRGNGNIRLFEDLRIDSLLMVEIIMLIEDCLAIEVNNDELRDLRNLGQVDLLLRAKLRGRSIPTEKRFYDIDKISEILSIAQPNLYLRDAIVSGQYAEASYRVHGGESPHFGTIDRPHEFSSMLVVEAIDQLALLFLLKSEWPDLPPVSGEVLPRIGCIGVNHARRCKIGDTIQFSIELSRIDPPEVHFCAKASVENAIVTKIEDLFFEVDFSLGAMSMAGGEKR